MSKGVPDWVRALFSGCACAGFVFYRAYISMFFSLAGIFSCYGLNVFDGEAGGGAMKTRHGVKGLGRHDRVWQARLPLSGRRCVRLSVEPSSALLF